MTSLSHMYQDFSEKPAAVDEAPAKDESEIEEEKLQSFENGYQAGWDDAIKAQSETNAHVSTDLAKNLQEISFSYHEARGELVKSLRPLFQDIAEVILPATARHTIGTHIAEQLSDMVRAKVDQVIEITVAPENLDVMENISEDIIKDPFVLLTRPDLGEGQVQIRIGSSEREIDLDGAITGIRDAIDGFFENAEKDTK